MKSEFDCADSIALIKQKLERKKEVIEKINDLKTNKPENFHNRILGYQYEISMIKADIAIIRETLEYPRFKTFIVAVKSYLTKEQYEECWRTVDAALENPDKYFQKG